MRLDVACFFFLQVMLITLPPPPLPLSASWQSGLSNSAVVGQLIGLTVNGWAQDRFGCRPTYMLAMAWMIVTIFIPVFANSLPALIAGEILCGECGCAAEGYR